MNFAFGTSFSGLSTASTVRSFGKFASYNCRHNTNLTKLTRLTEIDCLLGIAINVHFLTVKEYSTTTTLGILHRSALSNSGTKANHPSFNQSKRKTILQTVNNSRYPCVSILCHCRY